MGSNMETQRRLMKKYKISFGGPIDSIRNPPWSSNHATIFQHIRELGKTDFHKFRDSINADLRRHPWRENVQRRAERIAQVANLCLESRKNELGWRLSLEHAILGRFTVEVACRNCRGRLWRSEVEVVSNNIQEKDTQNSLESRQQRRQPCACDKNRYADDLLDHGTNPLFDNRIDEAMVYSPAIKADLPKREERPDLVYGLRPTNRLQRLLEAAEDGYSSADDPNKNELRSSPFRVDGVPILFPFLILEAKSEKSASAFSDIQVQTAFGIRELLSLQDGLAQAAGEDSIWDGGPLVWFLSYKGEQWRVHAAFIERTGVTNFYRTVQLWNGGINSPEHALQLLLIIDYIVDWARDLYREGIAQSLQKLSGDDFETIAGDTDIFSLSGKVQDWRIANEGEEIDVGDPQGLFGDPLRAFDSPVGAFRDARFIRTRFIGLYLVKENFHHLVNCTPSREASKKLANSLLGSLGDFCRLRRHMLDELEISWTNKNREGLDMTPPDEVFIVSITALWYFTPNWEQTRELSYLAVSESLLDDIFNLAGINRSIRLEDSRTPIITSIPSFGDLLKFPATDNLSACASRACLYTTRSASSNGCFTWKEFAAEKSTTIRSKWRRETVIGTGPRPRAREFVYRLYLRHKIGRCEPTSPIFRLSAKLDELAPVDSLLSQQYRLVENVWPWTPPFLHSKYKSLVVAASGHNQQASQKPDLCIFVMDPSMLTRGLKAKELVPGSNWYLQVRRFDQKPGWNGNWNMKNVQSDIKGVMTNLKTLIEDLKSTKYGQGSEGHTKRLSQPERNKETIFMKTRWDILTQGGVEIQSLDNFEFDTGSPYRRHEWNEESGIPLLRLRGQRTADSEPLCIVIEDDDDNIQSNPSLSVGKQRFKVPQEISDPPDQADSEPICIVIEDDDDNIQSNPSLSVGKQRFKVPQEISDPPDQAYRPPTPRTSKTHASIKLEIRDTRVTPKPVTPTRKRVREQGETCEEGESSTQAARKQELKNELLARYYSSNDK